MTRTKRLQIGTVEVGGGAPVTVQSMTNTDTCNHDQTLHQIRELADEGCQIIRVAVPSERACISFGHIVSSSPIPVVADIHFSSSLAIMAIESGAACVRINPGNIGGEAHVQRVADAARDAGVPIRIGVNAGSIEEELLSKYGAATAEALVESALAHCALFERYGWDQLKVSLKCSEVRTTVDACRLFASQADYPLHLGVTEAGSIERGVVKSAVGIGALLLDGIGDTIRVSLTAPPIEEVRVAIHILEAVGLRSAAPEIVSCPTCARTGIELISLVEAVEREVRGIKQSGRRIKLGKIALMGCVVNGPGEARDADIGIAGTKEGGVLFRKGEVVARLAEPDLLPALLDEIRAASFVPTDTGHASQDDS